MNKWLKLVCLILAIVCTLGTFVACGDDEEKSTSTAGINKEGVDKPNSSGETYDDATFTMYSVEDMFPKQYFFADKTTGDGMNDALYQRQRDVEQLLGVKLIYRPAEASGTTPAYQTYASEVKNAIKAGTEKYQLVLSHAYYAIPDLITSNSLYDFKEFSSIDYTESYWNKSVMDQLDYKGHYYLGYSDFNLATTYIVAFNKSLYANNIDAFQGKTMYDFVKNNEWTIQKMADVATLVYEDAGGVDNNTYGLPPSVGFLSADSFSPAANPLL